MSHVAVSPTQAWLSSRVHCTHCALCPDSSQTGRSAGHMPLHGNGIMRPASVCPGLIMPASTEAALPPLAAAPPAPWLAVALPLLPPMPPRSPLLVPASRMTFAPDEARLPAAGALPP